MFQPTRYLAWARRFYGQVRFDLASSGMPPFSLRDLGVPGVDELEDVAGWTGLRERIAAHNCVAPEEAVVTLGTSHALWLAYASLASAGDDVLVEEPAYEPLVRAAEGVGARVLRFARDPRERYALDPDRIARAMTPRTRVVAVTNLHNPSGVRTSDATLAEAARVAAKTGATLLVDEVYAAFDSLVDANGTFSTSARRVAHNVVAISSLTKCYGLGSLRVGWLLGPSGVAAQAQHTLTATCGFLPLAHAQMALHAFRRLEILAARSRSLLAGKRETVEAWAASHDLVWSAPAEGLFGFATVPEAGDLTSAIESAARDHDVLVAPGSFFGTPGGFRVAWSAPAGMLGEGLARLAQALQLPRGR